MINLNEIAEVKIDGVSQKPAEHEELVKLAEKLKPHHILQYATGAAGMPGSGFGVKPTITFNAPDDGDSYIHTSTCACRLSLPVTNTTKDMNGFIFVMLVSLSHGATFSTT